MNSEQNIDLNDHLLQIKLFFSVFERFLGADVEIELDGQKTMALFPMPIERPPNGVQERIPTVFQ